MKILLIADPGIAVPPTGYGGIERVIAGLARSYSVMGHDVTVFASYGSCIEGTRSIIHSPIGFPAKKSTVALALFRVWIHLMIYGSRYDLIQNFGRLANLIPVWWSSSLKFMCYQRHISQLNIQWATYLRPRRLEWIACARHLTLQLPQRNDWKIIPNPFGSNLLKNEVKEGVKPSLVFLGRLDRIKGCHHAIEVSKSLNLPLTIAGNISQDEKEINYFNSMIVPEIDGVAIQYIGEVDDDQKAELLAQAGVLLFPLEWDEPFGIVMVEAMSQGTPVIAFNRGSATEVIDQGITGFVVNTIEEMKYAIPSALKLNRALCRQRAEERFSQQRIAKEYLTLASQ